MLTFSSSDGSSIRVAGKAKTLVFFPKEKKGGANDMMLFPKPDEAPEEGTISWPGEYDIDGVAIRGIGQDEGGHVSYVIETDGVRCAFLPAPLHDWSDHDLELLGDVAVLAIQGDDPKKVQKIMEDVDPRVLIPLKAEGSTINEVLKACGATGTAPVSEYKLKGSLPAEGREVVVLEK